MIGAKIAVPNLLPWLGGVPAPSFTGLLDTYSGAEAAYSVRRLSGSYSGSAIRVRESSGGTEADIGFDGENLDETALLAHCGANDGFVTTWYDQSGNGNDAEQSTAGSQPQIVSAGTVVKENGLPALDYDGVNDFFDVVLPTDISQPDSFFFVNTYKGTGALDLIDNYPDTPRQIVHESGGFYALFSATSGDNSTFAVDSNQNLIFALFNGASSEIALNGVSESLSLGTSGFANTFEIGRSFGPTYSNYKYQELIIYPSDQSSNRTNIEDNINAYFSIYT